MGEAESLPETDRKLQCGLWGAEEVPEKGRQWKGWRQPWEEILLLLGRVAVVWAKEVDGCDESRKGALARPHVNDDVECFPTSGSNSNWKLCTMHSAYPPAHNAAAPFCFALPWPCHYSLPLSYAKSPSFRFLTGISTSFSSLSFTNT